MTTEQLLSLINRQSEIIDQLTQLCAEAIKLLEQYKSIDEEEKKLKSITELQESL